MLKLKDVSKFYYNKGIIATGFTKVNLDFKLGEFVVIVGESGSGKSTLLNVLSGMDSYEEGEMYINGNETSHYLESEFETYRKKYIANIFQNFNLVNSYTVYQNVELVLLINGYKKSEIKQKIYDILKQVDLYKFRKTKASKLSGGQKQRVAIARALAKETQIIVADEPTGNLDTRSAASVLSILYKISKDKLIIMVTHNYDQVEKYATRKIKMHDGKVIEDKQLQKIDIDIKPIEITYNNISVLNKFRLGLRNTFNIIPKFSLLLFVYLFIVSGFLFEYSAFKKAEYEESKNGYNGYFKNTDDKRIIIKKEDKSYFTEKDYDEIESINNIDYVFKDDKLLDNEVSFNNNDLYLYGNLKDIKSFNKKLDIGRMPESDNELVVMGRKDDYYLSRQTDAVLNSKLFLSNLNPTMQEEANYQIVGISYWKDSGHYGEYSFYGGDAVLNKVKEAAEISFSNIKVTINNKTHESSLWNPYMGITPNKNVPVGNAYVGVDLNYSCSNYNCHNKKIIVNNKHLYYSKEISLTINKTYNKNTFESLTGIKNFDEHQGRIFVNPTDYKSLFDDNYYQSSVFVKDIKEIDAVNTKLKNLNYHTLMIKDALINNGFEAMQVLKIIKVVITGILIVVMFFIAYFIIKLILKSRNIYFTTIRILGSSKSVCKKLLDIELLTIANLAYFTFISLLVLVNQKIINFKYLKDLITYLKLRDYIIIYIIIILMTQLISSKFAKSLFKKSAMKTFSEVV